MRTCALMVADSAPSVPAEASDAELLERYTARGDRDAMSALLSRHANAAYRLACHYLRREQDAEDVVQEAFTEVCRHAGAFRRDSTVRSWVLGFVVNVCRHHARSDARWHAKKELKQEERVQPNPNRDAELREWVRHALRELPEDLRLTVWMHYGEGLTAGEIATTIGQRERTVRSHISRGVDELRRLFTEQGAPVAAFSVPALMASLTESAPASLHASLPALVEKSLTAGIAAQALHPQATMSTTAKVAAVLALSAGIAATGAFLAFRDGASNAPEGDRASPVQENEPAGPEKPASKNSAQLGDLGYMPSPENPVGWRGDGTGRYPGATPPIEWFRRPKKAPGFACQSKKPSGSDAPKLEYTYTFGLKHWLTLGPFLVPEAKKGMADELFPGEAAIEADEGMKTGEFTWKEMPMDEIGGHLAGFHGVAGRQDVAPWSIPNPSKIAYVHTYIYSEKDTKVKINLTKASYSPSAGIWVNGTKIDWKMEGVLKAGWNRLLFKFWGWRINWGFSVWLEAPLDASVDYESKNIAWTRKIPQSVLAPSSPIVVGDKIFLTSDPFYLYCLNKSDGRFLWCRSVSYFDAMRAQLKAAGGQAAEKAEQTLARLQSVNDGLIKALNEDKQPDGAITKERDALHRELDEQLKAADPQRHSSIHGMSQQGQQGWCPTPCSDGKRVYVWTHHGYVAAFDLNGNFAWGATVEQGGDNEHGWAVSPVLAGGKFIVRQKQIWAFDAQTGSLAWQHKANGTGHGSLLAIRRGNGQDALYVPNGYFFRIADGKFWNNEENPKRLDENLDYGAVFTDENTLVWVDIGKFRIADISGSPKRVAEIPRKIIDPAGGEWASCISQVVVEDNLVYSVTEIGYLIVADLKKKEELYRKQLDVRSRFAYVAGPGFCSSLAVAGKHIYAVDDYGTTFVLEPGPSFKLAARNELHMSQKPGEGQPIVLSTPIFDGSRMYLRSPSYLFCIGEK